MNIAKQKETENKLQKLVDAENANIYITPTSFTKRDQDGNVLQQKIYTTDGQGTESLTEVT